MNRVRPVVLSGGSGTRLWPLSVGSRPKQFLRLDGKHSLFAATLARAAALPRALPTIVVTGPGQVPLVEAEGSDHELVVLVEPGPRNTAPAIVAAALASEPDDILFVLPSDHLVRGQAEFAAAAAAAVDLAADGGVVTFGSVPDRPETGYGWIKRGDPVPGGYLIDDFVEKPDQATATALLEDGYLWNTGIFVVAAGRVIDEATATEGLLPAVETAVAGRDGSILSGAFLDAPSISFDHAVMEHTRHGVVVPLDAGWSDVGSWQAVWDTAEKDEAANSISGEAFVSKTSGSLVYSSTRPVAVIGLSDVVVVETGDGVLVVTRALAQEVREAGLRFGDDRPKQ